MLQWAKKLVKTYQKKKKKRKDQNNKEYWQAYTEKKVMVHLDV